MRASLLLIGFLGLAACADARAGPAVAGAGEIMCGGSGLPACQRSSSSTTPVNQRAAAAAAAMNALQNNLRSNTQNVNNAAASIGGIIQRSQDHNNANNPSPDSAGDDNEDSADAAPQSTDTSQQLQQQAADEQQRRNNEAAALLQAANAAVGTLNAGAGASQGANATLNSLLNPASTSGTGTANATLNNLLSSTASHPSVIFPLPGNPMMNAAADESEDQPDQTPGATASLAQALQSAGQHAHDALDQFVNPSQGLISSITADRVVQWITNPTTVPLPTPSDSPEAMADAVSTQAVVGFGDVLKGMAKGPTGVAKGLYASGSKMVNQLGAVLGFADANIFDTAPADSQ